MPIIELKRNVYRSDHFNSALVREKLIRRMRKEIDASAQAFAEIILKEKTLHFPIKMTIDVESKHWYCKSSVFIDHNNKTNKDDL